MSDRIAERQSRRDGSGRYERYNRCEVCNKRAGDREAEYYSDDRCNRLGPGLILCRHCATRLADIADDGAYLAAFPTAKQR